MADKIAVSHYCEGAGHATRMLAVAKHLEEHGMEVTLAGGGAGETFIAANGYNEYVPQQVRFIDAYQHGSWFAVLRNIYNSLKRVRDLLSWLRREDPDFVVTDDMFCIVAATVSRYPFVFVTHDAYTTYDNIVEAIGAEFWNSIARLTAEDILMPVLWEPPGYGISINPIALESDESPDMTIETLLVPSEFTPTESLAQLSNRDDVTLVGGEDWDIKPCLQPYIREADTVICSGYSTIMECAVAGTPCIAVPQTSEQRGVCSAINEHNNDWLTVAETVDDALTLREQPTKHSPHANGAQEVATYVAEAVQITR